MKGGAHQSLLTLMRTLACLHRKGVGLVAIHGKGIWCCTGKGLEAGMKKDWGGMGECYNFEGNGGGGVAD